MNQKLKDLLRIFGVFFLIGILNFGGGYSVMPFLQREIVQKRAWATEEEIVDYYVIGQCLPGLILINIATFVGYKKQNFWGAVFAISGIVFPAVVAAFAVSIFMMDFLSLSPVQNIIMGVNVAVVVLIFQALWQLLKTSIVDKFTWLIFLMAFLLSFKISPVWIILGAGLLGFWVKKFRGEIG